MMTFEKLSDRTRSVFGSELDYKGFKNLMSDLNSEREIFDEDGTRINKVEAENTVRNYIWSVLGIDEHSTKRDRKRAMKAHSNELFTLLEDDIDFKVATGFKESEFFNAFVEYRNIALGDDTEFYSITEVLLTVDKVAGNHHDFTLQRLGEGETMRIPVSTYGMAVGTDIDLYLTGRVDFAKLTDACASAFLRKTQDAIFAATYSATDKIPSTETDVFVGSGALSSSTKADFDAIIDHVSMANDGAAVTIIGTKNALRKLDNLIDVNWRDDGTKAVHNALGRIGNYEGNALLEVPNRFKKNDVTGTLIPNDVLLFIPSVEDKFVKMIDRGETEILEITEKGARMDDTMKYEIQRDFGVGIILGRYHGKWTLA